MKTFFQKSFKTLAFLACLLALLYLFSCIFSFKYEDGINPIARFYDLPEDTVDVLLLGSSHMGMNVDPSILWNQRGIAAYSCWGSMQQPWNTYYYLKECLKYQQPKLVVMDVYGVTFDGDLPGYDNIVKNTQGLRFSRDKIENILVSSPEEYRSALLLGIPCFHYRYSEICAEDFNHFFWNKDTGIQSLDLTGLTVQSFEIMDVSGMTQPVPLAEKCETYFRKILDLCQEEEIPILLVASPYYLHEQEQGRFNRIGEIADDYGVTFLNFNENYPQLSIDPQTDFCDLAHMMPSGVEKYDSYLADYIVGHYEVPDRRLDSNHIWNQKTEVQTHCVYALENKFYGGGRQYLDTGVQLYKNPYYSFTLMTRINTEVLGEDTVWMSCFSEEEQYRGMLLNRNGDNLYFIFNRDLRIEISEFGQTVDLALVKEGLHYTVYVDGVKYKTMDLKPFESLEDTLLLGCQRYVDGSRFRYSNTEVDNLEIYDIALSADDIAAWDPAQLPEPPQRQAQQADSDAAFSLNQRFVGDGFSKYLDTGIAPYSDPNASWTLLTQFREDAGQGAGVYFSSFCEDEADYRGIMARKVGPGQLNLLYGNRSIITQVPEGSDISLAIVKDEVSYTIYVNGERIVDGDLCETNPWQGDLLIGCQETMDGEKMRFSGVTVYNLEFYNGVMTAEDILAWAPEFLPEPPAAVASPVDYCLENPFLGNGSSSYVDTGIQLYDVADKSWTLEMKFRKNGAQTLATCFAEDPSCYRGLVISTLDNDTLNLTLGQTGVQLELAPQPEQELKIVKDGYQYTVYLNGQQAWEATSTAPEYDGTVHIGCGVDGMGKPFRFSSAKILEFRITGPTDQ